MVFGAGDVGEDGVVGAFDNQTHGDAGTGGAQRHSGVEEGESAGADSGH